jgi:predicted metal-dependent phosphoesterase TrpH
LYTYIEGKYRGGPLMRLDAHCHTDCSDGNLSIEERIDFIRQCGFDAATITDHDFISEEQVRRACAAAGDIPFIPGIELTLSHQGAVVHLLGYYVDPSNIELRRHIARVQNLDQAYTSMLIELFRPRGISFGLEDLISSSLHTHYSMCFIKRMSCELYSYNRKHTIAIFLRALSFLGMRYADFSPWPVREGIDLIHAAGGYAVLAHPGGAGNRVMRELGFLLHEESHISQYADWGLDGIEVACPAHSVGEKHLYSGMAERYNLIKTAGSDCHGKDPLIGASSMGSFSDIPEDLYDRMLTSSTKVYCMSENEYK